MIELYVVPAGIPESLDRNRPVVIIDVFRASTSITAALAVGATAVRFAGSHEEAAELKKSIGKGVVMAGERGGLKIDGYDLGNSPWEMTADVLAGRTAVFNSTNGTRLLKRFADFDHVMVGSLVSLTATVRQLERFSADPILCCAGGEGYFSAEDTLAAGMMLARLPGRAACDDAAAFALRLVERAGEAWRQWAKDSVHGRCLASLGLADDLDFCLDIDRFDFVPVKSGAAIVKGM